MVRTFFLALVAIVRLRHSRPGLLLSELGAHIFAPAQAPAGTRRLTNLLRSPKWSHALSHRFLWHLADQALSRLEQQGELTLAIWDENVLEKPESIALEGLCPARSSKAARLKRIKPRATTIHREGHRCSCRACNGSPSWWPGCRDFPPWRPCAGGPVNAEKGLTHLENRALFTELSWRCLLHIAEGGTNQRDLRNEGRRTFHPGDSRGTGHFPERGAPVPPPTRGQALKSPEAMRPRPRSRRASKLDPYTEYVDRRMSEGLENCVVMHRELRSEGYDGGYSILKSYMSPRRRRRQPDATMRFETAPGEQAQVDWGSLGYLGEDGKRRRIRVFVMTLGWSRACYVELVRRADTAAFIRK